jgi:hypothetical protein
VTNYQRQAIFGQFAKFEKNTITGERTLILLQNTCFGYTRLIVNKEEICKFIVVFFANVKKL